MGGILGAVVGAGQNKKAIKKASAAQIAALEQAIAEDRRQFDTTRGDYAPYMGAGADAIGGMGDLTGLNGDPAQAQALAALQNSPYLQSIIRNGTEGVLQNASATGGLRGGNVQHSLADFRADAFAQTIQQQLQNLGGIAGIGSGMTQSLGGLGAQSAANVGNMLIGQGNARAGSILGRQQVNNNLSSQISQILSSFLPGGGVPGLGGMKF